MSAMDAALIELPATRDAKPSRYLDELPPMVSNVGYGTLGRGGALGYEGKSVIVQGRHRHHALSTHAPARLLFRLGGGYTTFRCAVGFNDDVPAGASHCDFRVVVDGGQVCSPVHAVAGMAPKDLVADVTGAQLLELVVTTSHWQYCHSVWLDPVVDCNPAAAPERVLDCLGRVEILVPPVRPRAARCIATVASGSFAGLLEDMLGSLRANADCEDALVVVFSLNNDERCRQVADKFGATVIPCIPLARLTVNVKAVLYSVARVVDAEQYLCLDADMLVLRDLRPIFGALDACPAGTVLVCREGNNNGYRNLNHALTTTYGGAVGDVRRLLGTSNDEGAYPLVVNDGLFAASRTALLAVDGAIAAMSEAKAWLAERPDISWRNQFIFNLALARLDSGVALDSTYNVQLHVHDVEMRWSGGRVAALWNGAAVRVLHFSGGGKRKYPEWRGLFSVVQRPLSGHGGGDLYEAYQRALRVWLGRFGVEALTWSFYGMSDACSARVSDPSTFPLLALLHYLVRANGCVRIVETGTAKGVSTACLASAVAHRHGGRIVTFDPTPQDERLELWSALPPAISACIEERRIGSLEGMSAAIAAEEQYHAALLDSIHSEEQVWEEFQRAAQLVCVGGLILIHDAWFVGGTVEQALRRIEAAGYGVTRLWTAESGIREDDHLGLAVIENRLKRHPHGTLVPVAPIEL
jgi:predicted O-methyltransferase YrrM